MDKRSLAHDFYGICFSDRREKTSNNAMQLQTEVMGPFEGNGRNGDRQVEMHCNGIFTGCINGSLNSIE